MRALLLLIALTLGACQSNVPGDPAPPGDGDGDADYLTDAEEAQHGTDPNNPDSDNDSYLDGDEVTAGTDPLDGESRIYTGGWPFNRFKDAIVDPGFDGAPAVGGTLPRLIGVDQHGEAVDLYDFAGHGKPVVIDLSAGWCGACREVAAWLAGDAPLGTTTKYDSIPERVRQGEILWVTVMFENASSLPATPVDVAAWHATYPTPHIAVITDDDRALYDFLWPGGYPAIFVLDDEMALRVYDRFDYTPALDALL